MTQSEPPMLPILREEIRAAGGAISFARFMELCLYHPRHGYYNSERIKLGKQGDFFTNMHLGPVYARIMARHFVSLWDALGNPARFDLVEMGPGDGQFARELLPWIRNRFPQFAAALRYTAVEQSARQRAALQEALGSANIDCSIQAGLPENAAYSGGIFCHEFFDALPVHILVCRNGRWKERCVGLNGNALVWRELDPADSGLISEADKRLEPGLSSEAREEGWQAEISPASAAWALQLEKALQAGELLVVDYGYTLEEWQLGRFRNGSAMGYREHKAVEDLLAAPGDQDLTAHVNFDLFLEATASLSPRPAVRFRSQSRFLMEAGEADQFADVFEDCSDENARLQRARQLKTLILPEGMGGTFQVLQIRKTAPSTGE
jgi:SAM-dependent MidA family methyltransferase